jgi:hypothetical protein
MTTELSLFDELIRAQEQTIASQRVVISIKEAAGSSVAADTTALRSMEARLKELAKRRLKLLVQKR